MKLCIVLIWTTITLVLFSCKKNSDNSIPPNLKDTIFKIGDTAYGGIVFYKVNGIHGLVCALTDQSDSVAWDPNCFVNASYRPQVTNATATAIGTGTSNTNLILAIIGNGFNAASLCRNYKGGGYSDWFLPSKDELNLMYINLKSTLFKGATKDYWSSTEVPFNIFTIASCQNFYSGNQNEYNKSLMTNTRAVRAF